MEFMIENFVSKLHFLLRDVTQLELGSLIWISTGLLLSLFLTKRLISVMEPEAGGEPLSKNELKRRQKAEKKAAEKAEKAAAKVKEVENKPVVAKAENALNSEEITPNEYFKLRSAAVEELKNDDKTHPYPHKFHVTVSLTEFIEKYTSLEDGQSLDDVKVQVAGRIHAIRESGAKLHFYDLRGEGTKIQVSIILIYICWLYIAKVHDFSACTMCSSCRVRSKCDVLNAT